MTWWCNGLRAEMVSLWGNEYIMWSTPEDIHVRVMHLGAAVHGCVLPVETHCVCVCVCVHACTHARAQVHMYLGGENEKKNPQGHRGDSLGV